MRLNPAGPPWWELQRGDGPITRQIAVEKRTSLKAEIEELEQSIHLLSPNAPPNSAARVRLLAMKERRNEIRAGLGLPHAVRNK